MQRKKRARKRRAKKEKYRNEWAEGKSAMQAFRLLESKGAARLKHRDNSDFRRGADLIAPQALIFLGPFAVY